MSMITPAEETTTGYNGWTNYETWNVSLFIQNEYPFYKAACHYVEFQNQMEFPVQYTEFVQLYCDLLGSKTPDGVSWTDSELDTDELDEMLSDLVDS